MKKQTQLLSALALSVGLTLSASFQAVASIPGQVADQAPLPSLAPMLEKVLPAVVSVWQSLVRLAVVRQRSLIF